jgi:hypothetical protein
VDAGVVYTLAQLAARMGCPHGQMSQASALVDVMAQLCIAAIAVWALLDLSRPATQAVLLDTTPPAAPAPASAPRLTRASPTRPRTDWPTRCATPWSSSTPTAPRT